MIVLGIESSCDETAVSLVRDGRERLSSVIASSAELHKAFGGVVPEIASRMHVEAILPTLQQALTEAKLGLEDVDLIAVTEGPGLAGALLVGISAAKALAFATGLPLVGVHHIAAHIAANYLADPDLCPPFVCLVVSGGHSQLVHVRDYCDYAVLASTRDDAAGEAFDKVARALGLGYPGGPLLDRLAQLGRPEAIRFPRTRFADSLDFSFSGVKTAGLTFIEQSKRRLAQEGRAFETDFPFADFAAAYQEAILQALLGSARQVLIETRAPRLCLAGGVAANHRLRTLAAGLAQALGIAFTCPAPVFCTDNAAMVASLGYYQYRAGHQSGDTLNARPHWPLAQAFS